MHQNLFYLHGCEDLGVLQDFLPVNHFLEIKNLLWRLPENKIDSGFLMRTSDIH